MTTLEEALADVKPEGDTDPFKDLEPKADQEKATPSESQTEKEPKVDKPVQGDNTDDINVPFNKRWEKHAENLKSELETRHQQELASIRQEFESKLPKAESNIPEWFKELYGENEVAWQKYAEHSKQEREDMKKELFAEQETKRQEAQREEQHWNKWVEDGIDGLKILGLDFDRNALIKTMLDNPDKVTRDNNFDFNLGYKLYRENNPDSTQSNSQARKKLADTTTKSSPSEKGSKDYKTSNELRNKSWNQL